MLKVVAIMFCGMGAGYLLRKCRLGIVSALVTVFIWLLLFFLGLEVGANPRIISAIQELGLEALLLSLAGIAGSVALAWALWRFASRKKSSSQEQKGGQS